MDADDDDDMDGNADSATYRAEKNIQHADNALFKSICPKEQLPYKWEHAPDDATILSPDAAAGLLRMVYWLASKRYSAGTINNIYASCARYLAWTNNRLWLPHLPGNWADWAKDRHGNRIDMKDNLKAWMNACCKEFKKWWETLPESQLPVVYVPNQLIEDGKVVRLTQLWDESFRQHHIDAAKEARMPRKGNPFKDPNESLGTVPVRMTPAIMHKGFVNYAVWTPATCMPTVLDPQGKMAQGIRALYQTLEPYAAELRANNRPYSDLITNPAFMTELAQAPPLPNNKRRG